MPRAAVRTSKDMSAGQSVYQHSIVQPFDVLICSYYYLFAHYSYGYDVSQILSFGRFLFAVRVSDKVQYYIQCMNTVLDSVCK